MPQTGATLNPGIPTAGTFANSITLDSRLAIDTGTNKLYYYLPNSGVRVILGGSTNYRDLALDYQAVGDGVTDNLIAVNNALAFRAFGVVFVPEGNFVVSALPTNLTGVPYKGPGAILLPETGGFHQLNTYADEYQITTSREYAFRIYKRLSIGGKCNVFVYGDSTIEGYVAPPSVLPAAFRPEFLLKAILEDQGFPDVSVTNRGISGTSWGNFLTGGTDRYGNAFTPIGDLATQPDLFIIKYGANDGVPLVPGESVAARLTRMAAFMRTALTTLRANANGTFNNLTILLMGPNSMNDSPNGRNEQWFEQVRQVYVTFAREFGCVYFDTYGYLKDARRSAGLSMDDGFFDGRAIHPLDLMCAWIWGGAVKEIFPTESLEPWATNGFRSIRGAVGNPLSSKTPDQYRYGLTYEVGQTTNGFPATGLLETRRQADGYAIQKLYTLATLRRVGTRYAANASTWDSSWMGIEVLGGVTYFNGWGSFGSNPVITYRSQEGICVLQGAVSGGTVAPAILCMKLAAPFLPVAVAFSVLPTNSGTSRVDILLDGSVVLYNPDATYTCVGNTTYTAA